jgi:hypothetical protein
LNRRRKKNKTDIHLTQVTSNLKSHQNKLTRMSASRIIIIIIMTIKESYLIIFKCHYCSEHYTSDDERIVHIGVEHPGRMFWPKSEDFENRLNPDKQN